MKFTNNTGLPLAFVNAAKALCYKPKPDNISVTTLLLSPRKAVLTQRHWEELEQDVIDRLFLLDGTLAHAVLEKYGEGVVEKYVFLPYKGVKLTGKIDLIGGTTLTDYKRASVWSYVFGAKADWAIQLNVYKWLAEQRGHKIDKLEIVAWYRDWAITNTGDADYPRKAIERYDIPVMAKEEVEKLITDKVEAIKAARELPDDDLPMCTAKEMFQKKSKFAVMKEGAVKALRVLDTMEEAKAWLMSYTGGKASIVERPGEYTGCMYYCDVWKYCAHGRKVRGWHK